MKIKTKYPLILFLPFLIIFIMLIIEKIYQKLATTINYFLIIFISLISLILLIISFLAYLKTKKEKLFYVLIAFFFFFINSLLLVLNIFISLDPLKVEIISNLFYLGTLFWLSIGIYYK